MRSIIFLLLFLLTIPTSAADKLFSQPDTSNFPNLYCFADTCHVYILKEGSKSILIDLGDGKVLDHLDEIGVTSVEWILFTHHHREQCQK